MRPLLVLWLGLACFNSALSAEKAAHKLTWLSGESLPGLISAANTETLIFQPLMENSPELFPEVAELRLDRLGEIRSQASAKPARTEAFEARLEDGSRLLAEVLGLDKDWLHLRSDWLGEFKVRRASVQALTRVRGDDLVFSASGPETRWSESLRLERGEDPFQDPFAVPAQPLAKVWRVSRSARANSAQTDEPQLWTRTAGGGFSTLSWSNTLASQITDGPPPPLLLRLDARLGSARQPQFVFKFAFPDSDLRVETWEDRLVLRLAHRFAVAPGRLRNQRSDLNFTVLWNRETGAAWLLDERGKELAVLPEETRPAPPLQPPKSNSRQPRTERPSLPSLSVENLGLDLTLHELTVTRWDGKPPPALARTDARGARLLDGRFVPGVLNACDEQQATLFDSSQGARQTVPLAQVLTIHFKPAAQAALAALSGKLAARLRSQAGEELTAVFTGITPSAREATQPAARLTHPAFAGAAEADLAHMESLVWLHEDGGGAVAAELPDRLRVGSQTVSGTMTPAGDAMPRWLFDGALAPVPLNPARQAVIERDERRFAAFKTDPDAVLLQMKSGDLLSARLTDLRKDGLRFTAPGVMIASLPAGELDAVHFPGKPLIAEGFADPAWRWLNEAEDTPALTDAAGLLLLPERLLAHPAMFDGGALGFTLHDESRLGMACLRLGLFTRPHDAQGEHLKLLLAFVGDEIYCGDEAGEGQMRRQSQVPHAGGPARVQIRLHEQRLLVRINDTQALSLDMTQAMRPGAGLILQAAGIWGNQPQALRISDFSARQPLQRLRVPQVEEEARRQALTIPRQRLSEPPAHVLMAPTGDLLRGTIESLDQEEIGLRWGMETLRVPRQRLAAVVLLDPMESPADETAGAKPDSNDKPLRLAVKAAPPHWLLLADGSRLGLQLLAWSEDGVTGLHPRLGRMRVPATSVQALWSNTPPPVSEPMKTVSGWKPTPAAAPEIPDSPAAASALVGTEAADFTLPLLDGGEFHLQGQRGRVVVLDFWASWCAPCVRALPELIAALKELPSDQVHLIGVNQGEPEEQVRKFLQARQWSLSTVLDNDQAVGRQYGVESIPHTVVIAPDGSVAQIKTGYTAESAREIAAKVADLLKAAR